LDAGWANEAVPKGWKCTRFHAKRFRPFQENKSPKNGGFSEEKASGLGGFNFWNYLRPFQENKSLKNGGSEEKASGLGGFNFWNYLSARINPSFACPSKREVDKIPNCVTIARPVLMKVMRAALLRPF
jgi:hypothetical protein